MIDFFDFIYGSISCENTFLAKIRVNSLFRLISRVTANIIVPIYFVLTMHNKKYALESDEKNKGQIIISLTTIPSRINRVWLVIETILRQSQKPEKILIWLSKSQFSKLDALPKRLLNQRRRGLEIVLKEGDIGPHKKYYYTLLQFPGATMITIDDDILYRSTMIADLLQYSQRYPASIISQYCQRIIWREKELAAYELWPAIAEETIPNLYSFFGTGGGTLFPPFILHSKVTNIELFMSLTPLADDVWLNAMCRLAKTKIVTTKYHSAFLPVIHRNNRGLYKENIGLKGNDKQIFSVREYFIKNYNVDPFQDIE